MNLFAAGGGAFGKLYEVEMYLYNAGNIDYTKNGVPKHEMRVFNADGIYATESAEGRSGLKVYPAASLGDGTSSRILEPAIVHAGLRNRLLSFADIDSHAEVFKFWLDRSTVNKRLFLDSGAFGAFTRGAKIDIDRYIAFIKANESELACYAGLDVIGDWRATAKNTAYMESKGLHPLPAFHVGSPFSELRRLCEQYDYICLGGLVPLSRKKIELNAHLRKCFAIIQDYWPKKTHLFGITSQPILERYPAYSCDSSNAILGAGMGRVLTFKNGRLQGKTYTARGAKGDVTLAYTVDKIGAAGSAHIQRRIHNIVEMLKFEAYLTQLWTKRGIVWAD